MSGNVYVLFYLFHSAGCGTNQPTLSTPYNASTENASNGKNNRVGPVNDENNPTHRSKADICPGGKHFYNYIHSYKQPDSL